MVKAEPDGHTILANSSAHTVAPSIIDNLPYDTAKDPRAVVCVSRRTPTFWWSRPRRAGRPLATFVAAAKAKTRHGQLRLRRGRHRDPRQRRAFPPERGHRGHPRSLPGRTGSARRHLGRPRRLLLLSDFDGAAADPRRPCAWRSPRARRQRAAALPRRADVARGRLRQTPTTPSGTACSCRRRRRARSSTSFRTATMQVTADARHAAEARRARARAHAG